MARKAKSRGPYFGDDIKKLQDAIIKYRRENLISPSMQDLANAMGKGKTTIFYYINYLDEIGWLVPRPKSSVRSFIPKQELEALHESRTDQQST